MELSTKYKRITIYFKQKYIMKMTTKSNFCRMTVTDESGLNIRLNDNVAFRCLVDLT